VFADPVGKDVVNRVWRKTKGDWNAQNTRSLAEEPIVRLILDGTVAHFRLDRKATSISLLVALRVRASFQKSCSRSRARAEKVRRPGARCSTISFGADLPTPELVVVDGPRGHEKAPAARWPDMSVQRRAMYIHRDARRGRNSTQSIHP
jgi:putative transposase